MTDLMKNEIITGLLDIFQIIYLRLFYMDL